MVLQSTHWPEVGLPVAAGGRGEAAAAGERASAARGRAPAPATCTLPGSSPAAGLEHAPLTGVQAAPGLAGEAGIVGGVAGEARGTPRGACHALASCRRFMGMWGGVEGKRRWVRTAATHSRLPCKPSSAAAAADMLTCGVNAVAGLAGQAGILGGVAGQTCCASQGRQMRFSWGCGLRCRDSQSTLQPSARRCSQHSLGRLGSPSPPMVAHEAHLPVAGATGGGCRGEIWLGRVWQRKDRQGRTRRRGRLVRSVSGDAATAITIASAGPATHWRPPPSGASTARRRPCHQQGT